MNLPRLRFKEFSGGWEEKTLEQLALVERGKFSIRPRNDPRYFGGSIPFVQTGDVVFAGLYLTRFSQTLNEEGLKVSRLFPKNTVLITIAANIGDTTITKFDVACTDSVVAIQPNDKKANPVWLKLSLDTKKDELDSKATQNAQKNINLQILKPLLLNTPSFAEQTKIANFLTAVDEKIAQLTQKSDLLASYKKGVMQQIFSQQLRFKDDDGREFPEWEEKKLGEVATFVKRKLTEIKDTPVMTISAGRGFLNQEDRFSKVIAGSSLDKYTYLKYGELAYNRGNSKTAKFGCIYMMRNDDALIPYVYHSFKLNNENNSLYLEYLSSLGLLNQQLKKVISSSARMDGLLNISQENFFKIKIKFPCLIEQTKIANFLTALDDKISQNQTQLNALKQYKQGLLQQMFV